MNHKHVFEPQLECGYRVDLLVSEAVVVEVKSVDVVIPVHRAQVLTYLRLGGWSLALLLNFNVATMKEGIERPQSLRFFAPLRFSCPQPAPMLILRL
jgi:GxxExxY protein